jgi:hypothetical protein
LKSRNNPFADKSLHWSGKRRAKPVTVVVATLRAEPSTLPIASRLPAGVDASGHRVAAADSLPREQARVYVSR